MRVSTDPFSNASSQHATEVEPDVVASGMTLVAALQQGRFFNAGSSDVGFATSKDGGATWTSGSLPGTTTWAPSPGLFDSVSDPSVAFDAKHNVWLMSTLPILFSNNPAPAVLVSSSTDAMNWNLPVAVAPGQISSDKDWITCDDTPSSPYYGHCYVEWDDPNANGLIHMSTSADGGATWGAVKSTADNAVGIGGQPLVQPGGTVIVPMDDNFQANMIAFTSHDGGATWSSHVVITPITDHLVAGNMRTSPLPSAAMDASGKLYLAWQDCRFRAGCSSNDIVVSTTVDGVSWTAPVRVPVDAGTSAVDHFIPGIGIDPATMGAGAHIGLTYYYFPNASCTLATCQLFAGFVGSQDGGATWTTPLTLTGPLNLAWLAQTSQGPMVGDYIATAFAAGHPVGIFAVANAPSPSFDEAMYVPKPGVLTLSSLRMRSAAGERPVPGVRSDHGLRPGPPIRYIR